MSAAAPLAAERISKTGRNRSDLDGTGVEGRFGMVVLARIVLKWTIQERAVSSIPQNFRWRCSSPILFEQRRLDDRKAVSLIPVREFRGKLIRQRLHGSFRAIGTARYAAF